MLRLDRISKQFPNGFLAVHNVSLSVRPGEILGVVGASGCGKSTLLRVLAGLERPTQGAVWVDGEALTAPRSDIGVVFQEPRLMPWLSIADNAQFGIKHLPRAERDALTAQALDRVGLARFADALPRELSGGMAQRAAIARALVAKPRVLLLDEPFSALDAFTRLDLQDHILHIWQYDHPTLVLVTHDLDEALALSHRVVVMRGQPGTVQGAFAVDLPRPRRRSSGAFQALKERIFDELQLARGEPAEVAAVA